MNKQYQIKEIPPGAVRILRSLLANMIGYEDRQAVSVSSRFSRGRDRPFPRLARNALRAVLSDFRTFVWVAIRVLSNRLSALPAAIYSVNQNG